MPSRFVITLAAIAGMAALPASAASDATMQSTHGQFLKIVNATYDSATSIATAPAGKADFVELPLGAALHGGLTDETVRLSPGDCLRDVRVTFSHGGTSLLHNINLCRISGLRLEARRQPVTVAGII